MEIQKGNKIKEVLVIIPNIYCDSRGHFFESFNQEKFESLNLPHKFVQDNESLSKKGVLRGLHFQKEPYSQGKLVRVIKGAVLDVVVDLRTDSPTFGKGETFLINEKNKKMVWVPEGFAHGFLCLEDNTVFQYKVTKPYNKESESGINWNDPTLDIDWKLEENGIDAPLISEKDKILPFFEEIKKEL